MATRQSARRPSIDEQPSGRRGSSTSSVHSVATPDPSIRPRRRQAARHPALLDQSSNPQTSSSDNPLSYSAPDHTGPHDGPSRDSVSTMRSSTGPSALDGPITYTPTTHRISKAKKGKRVHACEFPGCNKVFTRAEHRRRHELNHSPEASFSCPHAGCRKAFHRPDLLARHVERHELDAQGDHSYRGHEKTFSDVTSDSGRSMTQPPMTMPTPSAPGGHRGPDNRVTVTSILTPPVTSQTYHLPPALPWGGGFTLPDGSSGYPELMPPHLTDDNPIYSSPEGDGSMSPVSDTYGHYRPHQNSLSTIPVMDTFPYDSMMKPIPTTSSMPLWNGIDHNIQQPPQLIPEGFDERDPPSVDPAIQLSLANMDWDAWFSVWGQLSSIPGIVPSINGMAITDALNCVNCYWKHFHPLYPILHRPTFSIDSASPLIAAAVIAIGSQYDTRPNAKAFSIGILEACSKYLLEHKPKPITSRSHVDDLQSLIMLEVLGKFRSRRADVTFSAHFKRLYESLAQDRHWISMNPLKALETLPEGSDSEALEQAYKFWIGHETRRRILQSCYILELQQAVLFENDSVDFDRVRSLLFAKGKDEPQHELPMPCHADLWEAKSRDDWLALVKTQAPSLSLPAATDQFLFPSLTTHLDNDPFSTSLMLSHILNRRKGCPDIYQNLSSFYSCVSSSNASPSRTINLFTYHSFLASHHTPLRALLTVSGESWLFNKKLDREPDFLAAKEELRAWVAEDTDIKSAVWHAVQVLKLATGQSDDESSPAAESSPITSSGKKTLASCMLPSPWCIYLSALICWAYGFDHMLTLGFHLHLPLSAHGSFSSASSKTSSASGSSSSSSTPSATSTRVQMPSPISAQRDTDTYLAAMDVSNAELLDEGEAVEKGRTRGLLEWVRRNVITGEGGGLLNEAEGVLLRLVEGRSRLVCF